MYSAQRGFVPVTTAGTKAGTSVASWDENWAAERADQSAGSLAAWWGGSWAAERVGHWVGHLAV